MKIIAQIPAMIRLSLHLRYVERRVMQEAARKAEKISILTVRDFNKLENSSEIRDEKKKQLIRETPSSLRMIATHRGMSAPMKQLIDRKISRREFTL
jgi:hypothetical protein